MLFYVPLIVEELYMGFMDIFKYKQYKTELEKSNKEIEEIKSMFTPEMQEANSLRHVINSMKEEKRIAWRNNRPHEQRRRYTR